MSYKDAIETPYLVMVRDLTYIDIEQTYGNMQQETLDGS